MSQIIVTSRYLKSGTETKRKNYTRYIATRETVEIREQNMIEREVPATENSRGFFLICLKIFPKQKSIWNMRIIKITQQLKMQVN